MHATHIDVDSELTHFHSPIRIWHSFLIYGISFLFEHNCITGNIWTHTIDKSTTLTFEYDTLFRILFDWLFFFFVLELFVSKFIQIITIQSIYTCPFGISLVNLFANTILVIYMYIKFFVFFFSELWKNESRFVVLGWLMGLSVISLKFHVHWFTDCFSCMIDFAPIHWIQYVYWIIWIFLQYNILKCGSNVCLHELQYNQCGLLSFIFFLLNVVAVDELAPKLI